MDNESKKTNEQNNEFKKENLNFLGKWSAFFIERYRIVFLIILIISILGVSSFLTISRELQPEVILPYGNIFTLYSGVSPEEIESLITDKIEKQISDVSDIKNISSYSGFGYSQIFVEFNQGVDIDSKVSDLREKVSSIQNSLPSDSETPTVESFETNNSPILIINVTSDRPITELKNIADDISDRLESEADIKEALVIGGLKKQINVIVDPKLLYNYKISLDDINNAINSSNLNFPGGNITLDKKNYTIRTVGEFTNLDEIKNTVIKYNGNTPIYLKDIAKVENGFKKVTSYSRMSVTNANSDVNIKSSISISVKKKATADIINTSVLIKNILKDEKGTLYPDDITIKISGDTAKFVVDQLGGVTSNAISGLLLVLIVLFLFIGLRESIIVSTVIPLAIMSTLWLLKLYGLTLNTITLFSIVLAVGMLVDNGIVIMENIDQLRFKGYSAKDASIIGTNQIAPAVLSSMLTTVAAFFPIALTSGIMGAFIKSIPITVIFALVSSFLIAMTVTPALSAIILKKHRSDKAEKIDTKKVFLIKKSLSVIFIFILGLLAFREDGNITTLSYVFGAIFASLMLVKIITAHRGGEKLPIIKKYSDFLYSIVKSRKKRLIVISATFIAFMLSMSLIFTGALNVNMFANDDMDRLYIAVQSPNGSTIDLTDDVVKSIEKHLVNIKEIDTFVSNIGITGADSFEGFGGADNSDPTIAKIVIDLVDKSKRDKTSIVLAKELRASLKNIPGATIDVQELQNGPPQNNPVLIKINGTNLDKLRKTTRDLEKILSTIPGTRDISSSVKLGNPELQIVVNKEKAAEFGLNDLSIALQVRNAINGITSTTFTKNKTDTDIVIRTSENLLTSKSDIDSIYIFNRMGQAISLSQVAKIVEKESLTSIQHDDKKRYMYVSSKVITGYNATNIVSQFKDKVKNYNLDDNTTINYGGEFEDINLSFTEMFRNMLIAAILVFLILSLQFNSLSQPIIILITVPMAMIGVMPGLLITGNEFGFVAFIGVVSLVGIAVNDAIVLVDYINYLRKSGMDLYEAVKETGKSRFMPVMATTITTTGGILPLSLKEKFFQPLGVTLIFGLLTATVLTLVIIPAIYTSLEERKIRKKTKKLKKLTLKGGTLNEA
ncbi:efflux RND transporter permease subunit [Helicovermis profundi]|uniref:Efflux RND transporter permease subunit n=1 Tax=Helicovermis profundi TaxID=3065157 RepID=A0AAU9EBL7_9FIRM|nr:efflux RND transporter permease subunit [Clostridia bacterium S502]